MKSFEWHHSLLHWKWQAER